MKLYEKFKNETAESWIIALIVIIVIIFLAIVFIFPAVCSVSSPPPSGWGPDYCSIFRK